jgi:hydrogenase maturation protease
MVLVVGLGNPLMEDDGFGCEVIDELRRTGLPPGMSAEVAPDVLHLWSLWRGQREVWIVDAVQKGAPAGTVHRFDHDAVLELPEHAGSAHHLPFGASLRWLLHANRDLRTVRFRLWGAEPAKVSARRGLSLRVGEAVRLVAQEIRDSVAGYSVDRSRVANVVVP